MLRIKELREKKGLLQKEVATNLNIGLSTLSQYETGSREPDYNTLVKIAEYFNVSTDYLLGIDDKPNDKSIDDDIKFALFGSAGEITDEMYEEVKRFAEYVKKKKEEDGKK